MSRVKFIAECTTMLQDILYSEDGSALIATQNSGDERGAEKILRTFFLNVAEEDHIQGMLSILFYNPQKL